MIQGLFRTPGLLSHQGAAASQETTLGWVLLVIAIGMTLLIAGVVVVAIWRRRSATLTAPDRTEGGLGWIVGGGLIMPVAVLLGVFILTMKTQASLAMPTRPAFTVRLTGHRWWWEVRYLDSMPGQIAVAANELHLPLGMPVRLELISDDVIHSFWVPQLAGKTDLIPGQRNVMWIQAESAGVYRGACGEYCGAQHAGMALAIVAETPEQFGEWLDRQREPAVVSTDSAALHGAQVFASSACSLCHTVRGSGAGGYLGPDLTHVGSRMTLAAGTLPNNETTLSKWVANPQAIKPGSLMPAVPLAPGDLAAVVSYLRSLQ
jgi:cytochrome c oxidase subunit 2